ncbi:MAG: FkbM family methyltransferase [Acidimicrobiales bacterium]
MEIEHRRLDGRDVSMIVRPGTQDADVVREVWDDATYGWPAEAIRHTNVLDLGANIGAFTLWAAAAGAANVRAVEAEHGNFEQLRRNLDANPVLAKRIFPLWGAVTANSDVEVRVHPTPSGAGSWTETGGGSGELVAGFELEDLMGGLGDDVTVKCDIEGAEYELFAAAHDHDLRRILRLVVEFHRPGEPGGLGERPYPDSDPHPFGALVTRLAEHHKIHTHGQPSRGGLLWAERY